MFLGFPVISIKYTKIHILPDTCKLIYVKNLAPIGRPTAEIAFFVGLSEVFHAVAQGSSPFPYLCEKALGSRWRPLGGRAAHPSYLPEERFQTVVNQLIVK